MKMRQIKKQFVVFAVLLASFVLTPGAVLAGTQCGHGDNVTKTSMDLGCRGDAGPANPILDMVFGIIRFLSVGVGLIVVGSLIFAGIQYTASRADPQAVAAARSRIQNTLIALLIYIFSYAILNYVIPTNFFK